MLTKFDIYNAIYGLTTVVDGIESKKLLITLKLYRDRGEFDGSYKSAVECFKLAGY